MVCFDATCDAAPILEQRGAIVLKGCAAGAPLGAVCRLGCTAGFENTADEDGHCTLSGVGTVAAYSGQSVTCAPEREQNGQMSEAYCRMAATEAQLDCCELENADGVVCSADVPPTQCVVACAEIWEPLAEDCEQHLADFQELTSECAAVAVSFLAKAASSLSVVGFLCHPDAAGEYQLQDSTVGGKPHWALLDSTGSAVSHLYAVDEPYEGWNLGEDLWSSFAKIVSFEDLPPWGPFVWSESFCGAADAGGQDQLLTLTPSFSDHDCHEALQLLTPELSEFCFDASDATAFGAALEAAKAPSACEFDCAHIWFAYSGECGAFLQRQHPYLSGFTELCVVTHESMVIIDEDGRQLDAGGHGDHTFRSKQGVVYSIEEAPGAGLERTDLAIEGPRDNSGQRHVLADRIGVNRRGPGVHRIEWDAPESKSGMDIAVTALEGSGTYHLHAEILSGPARGG
jgi:hypothetical protein